MKNRYKLLLGTFTVMLIVFILPIFPLALPNKIGEFGGILWLSGLSKVGISLKELALIELSGAYVGLGSAIMLSLRRGTKW